MSGNEWLFCTSGITYRLKGTDRLIHVAELSGCKLRLDRGSVSISSKDAFVRAWPGGDIIRGNDAASKLSCVEACNVLGIDRGPFQIQGVCGKAAPICSDADDYCCTFQAVAIRVGGLHEKCQVVTTKRGFRRAESMHWNRYGKPPVLTLPGSAISIELDDITDMIFKHGENACDHEDMTNFIGRPAYRRFPSAQNDAGLIPSAAIAQAQNGASRVPSAGVQ